MRSAASLDPWAITSFGPIKIISPDTNPKARLCEYLIVNEKIAKMMHIALGSGFEPDRSTEYHMDIVFNAPRQKLDVFGVDKEGNKYWILIHSARDGKKVIQKKRYIGKVLPPRKNLEQIKYEFLRDISKNKLNSRKDIQRIKIKIIPLLKKYKIAKAGIFGSYAEGKEKKNSDVDILIQPTKNMGFKFAGLEIELSEKLGRKVDLVSYNGLSPYLKNRILKQEVRLI